MFQYLPADRPLCRSERLEENSAPACSLAGAYRPDARPVHATAGLPQPGDLKSGRIRSKSDRRERKLGGRGWLARGVEGREGRGGCKKGWGDRAADLHRGNGGDGEGREWQGCG